MSGNTNSINNTLIAKAMSQMTEQEYRKLTSKPIIKNTDMGSEMASECLELITMAVDKQQATNNYEAAAQIIKSTLDKKFGTTWHCAIGEGFGFDITYHSKNMLYVYYGQIGILIYKC